MRPLWCGLGAGGVLKLAALTPFRVLVNGCCAPCICLLAPGGTHMPRLGPSRDPLAHSNPSEGPARQLARQSAHSALVDAPFRTAHAT
jgi:hypothetical protein